MTTNFCIGCSDLCSRSHKGRIKYNLVTLSNTVSWTFQNCCSVDLSLIFVNFFIIKIKISTIYLVNLHIRHHWLQTCKGY